MSASISPSVTRLDSLQCLLLILSWIVAFLFPVELIVFAYVVLGPLHYLTEIVWLDGRGFFLPKKSDAKWLVGFTLAGSLAAGWLSLFRTETGSWLEYQIQYMAITVAMAALILSCVFRTTVDSKKRWMVGILAIGGTSLYFYFFLTRLYHTVFAILIPTLIHVFVFTAIFMLSGAFKSRSRLGLLSVAMFLGGGLVLLFVSAPAPFSFIHQLQAVYQDIFGFLETLLVSLIVPPTDTSSGSGIVLQEPIARFLAFAYTYHYVNWFSKTSIIPWHRMSNQSLSLVLVAWLVSVSLYVIHRQLGLVVVGVLSLLHVVLEFPLNWASLDVLRREVIDVWRNGWTRLPSGSIPSSRRTSNRRTSNRPRSRRSQFLVSSKGRYS